MNPRSPRIYLPHIRPRISRSLFKGPQVVLNMADKGTYSMGALSFDFKDMSSLDCVQRLGKLLLRDRIPIDTPHYFPISSRGCVPHLSQDMVRDKTSIRGIYVALEDCKCSTPDSRRRVMMLHED